jgi:hypothetical protein
MPKKKDELTQREQSKKFRNTVRELTDAGELNPTEADKLFERAFERIVPPASKPPSPQKSAGEEEL